MTTQYLVALIGTLSSPGALADIARNDTATDFLGVLPDGRGVITNIDAIVDAAIAGIGGAVVPTSRQILTSSGIQGGGNLTADLSLELTPGTLTSLGLADSAVQPARQVIAGTGLQGGGTLAADRTFSLNSVTLASLGKADTALQPALIGAANGIAPLGSDAKINASYLPAIAISESFVVANEAAMLALTAQVGDVAIRSDLSNAGFLLGQTPASTLANWIPMNQATGAVTSVAGKTGNVTLVIGDVTGLQAALDSKQNALTYVPVNKAGDTMTGELQTPYPICYGSSGSERAYRIRTGSTDRWLFGGDAALESTGNVGTDWFLARYNDAGGWLSNPIMVNRATGGVILGAGSTATYSLDVVGALRASGNMHAGGFFSEGRTMAPEIMLRPYGADTYRWRFIQGAGGEVVFQGSNDIFTSNFLNAMIVDAATGKMTLTGGIITGKNIVLANNYDLNFLSESGDYESFDPVNGPWAGIGRTIYVQQRRNGTDSNYAIQRAQLVNYNTDSATHEWIRRKEAGSWSIWTPVGGSITPEHYGATGNGVADDTDAVGKSFRSGWPVLLDGVYRITSAVQCGFGFNARTSAVKVTGKGKLHFINDHAGDCITIALETNPGNYPGNTVGQVVLKDFGIRAKVNNNQAAGLAIYGTGGSGSTTKSLEIHNVRIDGESDDRGFAFGMWLSNARNFLISGCTVQNKRNQTLGGQVGEGILVGGDSDPVDGTITDCDFYFGFAGVRITATCEGMIVRGSTILGADYGVFCDVHENPIVGDDAGKQLLHIDGGHINTVLYGVRLDRVWGWKVTNVDMLCWQANSNWQGIYAKVDSGADQQGWVDGCAFRDMTTGAVSSGQTIGVHLQGHTSGVLRSRIGVNFFTLLKTGILIDSNAKEVRYSAASVYSGVTTPVTNSGGGTNTSY